MEETWRTLGPSPSEADLLVFAFGIPVTYPDATVALLAPLVAIVRCGIWLAQRLRQL